MAHRAEFPVTGSYTQLSAGLTDGTDWIAQNVGLSQVEYCDAATKSAAESARGFLCKQGQFFEFSASNAEGTWVRTADRRSTSAIALNSK